MTPGDLMTPEDLMTPGDPMTPAALMTPAAPAPSVASRPRRLVLAGEALVDVLMRVPGLPPRGGDILATSSQIAVGGGFNVMAAAARQGLPVMYAGGHGTGPWGDLVRAALAAEGIGLLRPPDPSRDTGFDVALVESDAERTFVTSLGAESISAPGCWDGVPAGPGDAVYVSGYGLVPAGSGPVLGAWAAALPPGVLLFMDPGPLAAQIPEPVLAPVLARCDWLSCNAREAALLSGTTTVVPAGSPVVVLAVVPAVVPAGTPADVPGGAAEAARRLLDRTARASVIVRNGPDGCYLALRASADGQQSTLAPGPAPISARPPGLAAPAATTAARSPGPDTRAATAPTRLPPLVHIPAPTVTAVDTTGAGDAHAGVFLAALADGLPPADAARRANAAAALAVTRPGPATSPSRAELDAWLTQP